MQKRGGEEERELKSGQSQTKSIVDQSKMMLIFHGMLTWLVDLDSNTDVARRYVTVLT